MKRLWHLVFCCFMPKWGLTSHAEERSPIVSIKYLNEKCSWWGMISLLALSSKTWATETESAISFQSIEHLLNIFWMNLIYNETFRKNTKPLWLTPSLNKVQIFWEGHTILRISTVDLTVTTWDKSTVEISQKIVAFSEYKNFTQKCISSS